MGYLGGEAYLWVQALHVISVIAWFAGLFYLPRLFVYHCEVEPGSAEDQRFQLMEARLLRIIMNPAMIAVWVFGLLMLFSNLAILQGQGWMHGKLLLVVILTGFHMMLARWRRLIAAGKNPHGARFYRLVNEVPTVILILTVILAIVKPF